MKFVALTSRAAAVHVQKELDQRRQARPLPALPLARPFVQPLQRAATLLSLVSFCSASSPGDASCPAASDASPPQWSLMRVAGDGKCLFRALSIGAHLLDNDGELGALTFDEHTRAADELRGRICAELSKRRDDVAPFIDEDFDSYLARMAQPRTWGGEPELAMAPHVLKRPVSVYTAQGPSGHLALISRYGAEEYPGKKDVELYFHGAGHYDLLLRPAAQPQARL